MTLPPWLWRVLRSRKTRLAGKIGLCLGLVVAGGFYPVVNWWGRQEWEKAEAEVRAKGFPVIEGIIKVEELPESFFCQAGFLAEAGRPAADRLACHKSPGTASPDLYKIFSRLPGSEAITAEQARAARDSLNSWESRRRALIEATQQSTPLSRATVNYCVEIPQPLAEVARDMAQYLEEDAQLAVVGGKPDEAFESIEAYFRIIADLMDARALHGHLLRERCPEEIRRLVRGAIIGPAGGGFSEEQLRKIDAMLAGIDANAAITRCLREMPGECITIHLDILRRNLPGPAPRYRTRDLLASWRWDPAEIMRRAKLAGEIWKPFGFREMEMARRLTGLADVVDRPQLEAIRELGRSEALSNFMRSAGAVPQSRSYDYHSGLGHWQADYSMANVVLARYVIAIRRQVLRHGKVPAKLEDLDGDLRTKLPVDPLSGRALEYAVEGGFYTLGYSAAWAKGGKETVRFTWGE
ncbi:hypothetical protein [Haloferula sp. BvORR071]|uniref:hypothetical protein n=1 Tax=Haloferula sp. BvORR071 TaxID=1396141 RepID=UPI0005572060|nr:hypothetical protein [Haloferula sp. BvORR071]